MIVELKHPVKTLTFFSGKSFFRKLINELFIKTILGNLFSQKNSIIEYASNSGISVNR